MQTSRRSLKNLRGQGRVSPIDAPGLAVCYYLLPTTSKPLAMCTGELMLDGPHRTLDCKNTGATDCEAVYDRVIRSSSVC